MNTCLHENDCRSVIISSMDDFLLLFLFRAMVVVFGFLLYNLFGTKLEDLNENVVILSDNVADFNAVLSNRFLDISGKFLK
jgi:hypothetical protein